MIARRLEEVRRKLTESKLQAILVTFLPHIRYLTGFTGSNGLCVVTETHSVLFTDGRYQQQVKEEVQGFRVCISQGSLFEAVRKQKLITPKSRVGYEANRVPVATFITLEKLFPRTRFIEAQGLVEQIVSVKDDDELATIRQAADITVNVFGRILPLIKEGVREHEVAAEISYLHRKQGAEADAFEPIVASGMRGALPHARASEKKIVKGEMVTLDFGCRYKGYHSDLTRTVSVGSPSAELRKIYGVVRDAQQQAVDAARSGLKASALDRVARKHIEKQGYGKNFSHSLGHGLGLEVHEFPRISKRSNDVLRERNVITIEPGIYVPGVGGVRIEDDVVLRNGSCQVLTEASRELTIL